MTRCWMGGITLAAVTSLGISSSFAAGGPELIAWPDLIPQPPQITRPDKATSDDNGSAADQSSAPELGGVVQHGMMPAAPEIVDANQVVTDYDDVQVKIAGYVLPLDFEETDVKEFLLVPYVGACIHVPPPPPNQIIHVTSDEGIEVDGMFEPVWATGTLETASVSSDLADVGYKMQLDETEPYQQ